MVSDAEWVAAAQRGYQNFHGKFIGFQTIDSGEHQTFSSGMQRDTSKGKPRFDLLRPKNVPYEEQMLTRFARLMERGAEKYSARNWESADSEEELDRFLEAADRHMAQWLSGETDEDHAAAVMFNILGAETTKYRIAQKRGMISEDIHKD